ncbi:hypothetical protein GGF38_002493, partial [Coemansia sp. RSA 25]
HSPIAQGAGGKRSITDDGSGSRSKKQQYRCPYCEKVFARPSALDTHIRSHTGEKPYKCGFSGCSKGFSVHSNMRRHEKSHYKFPSARLHKAKPAKDTHHQRRKSRPSEIQVAPVELQQFDSIAIPSTPASSYLFGSPLGCVPLSPEVCTPSSAVAQLPNFLLPNLVLPQLTSQALGLVNGLHYGLPPGIVLPNRRSSMDAGMLWASQSYGLPIPRIPEYVPQASTALSHPAFLAGF